jgi:hypothetical protein
MFTFANKPANGVALTNRLTARAIENGCDQTRTSLNFDGRRFDDVIREIEILKREGLKGFIVSPHAPIPITNLPWFGF